MIRNLLRAGRIVPFAFGVALSCLSVGCAVAAEACLLCNSQIVTNSELAGCFLDNYDDLASSEGNVIVVDLSACETSRGGLEALPEPTQNEVAAEPDTQFIVSRAQLGCLKEKLEKPGLVLDPSARIPLGDCG